MTNSLNVLIYNKALKFSTLNNKKFSIGKLVNLSQVDAASLQEFSKHIAGTIFLPIRLIIGILLMYILVGVHFIPGLVILALVSAFSYKQGKSFSKYSERIMLSRDERMKITNETVSGIKLVKMNAWDNYFLDKILKCRDVELQDRKELFWVKHINIILTWMLPVAVCSSIFSSIVIFGDAPLTAANALTIIATFFSMQVRI
jgi:ABC-type multidrug transport system fused ATPase/permease subunit